MLLGFCFNGWVLQGFEACIFTTGLWCVSCALDLPLCDFKSYDDIHATLEIAVVPGTSGQNQTYEFLNLTTSEGRTCIPDVEKYDGSGANKDDVGHLRGKHIVFIGDSLVRYQYLNLVYYLEMGTFTSPWPSGVWEKGGWVSWNEFYSVTNSRLRGHEVCDCYRLPNAAPANIFENRFYHNPVTNIRVTYVESYGHVPMHYHSGMWNGALRDPVHASKMCKPGRCSKEVGKVEVFSSLEKWADRGLPLLNPDIIIINCGLWKCNHIDFDYIFKSFLKAQPRAEPRNIFWKTTTILQEPRRIYPAFNDPLNETVFEVEGILQQDRAAEIFAEQGARIFPAGLITRKIREQAVQNNVNLTDIYSDTIHFREGVYKAMNVLLLEMLRS